ncbi:MAG: right-handed parallel beta-helix repeat-containing protein [Thermoguttaceae bacterium]
MQSIFRPTFWLRVQTICCFLLVCLCLEKTPLVQGETTSPNEALWENHIEVPLPPLGNADIYLSLLSPQPDSAQEKAESQKVESIRDKKLYLCQSPTEMVQRGRMIRSEQPQAVLAFVFTEEFLTQHPLQSPVILTDDLSGTAEKPTLLFGTSSLEELRRFLENPTVQASPSKREKATFWGSVSLANPSAGKPLWQKWSQLKDSNTFQERLSPSVEERIMPEIRESLWVCDLKPLEIKNYGDATTLGLRPELFVQGKRQMLARGPNEGFLRSGKALGSTPIQISWAGKGTQEGVFEFVGEKARLERWKKETDLRLHGYWFWDWSEEYGKTAEIDVAESRITMQPPFHNYGYHDAFRYYAANALCELDTVGEWYLDVGSELLFWVPSEGCNTATFEGVRLSMFASPFMVEIRGASHIDLINLGFTESRGSGVLLENCTDCRLVQLKIKNMGRDGVEVQGGFRNGISQCQLQSLGAGGFKIAGGDRKTLTPGNHYLQNCEVVGFSKLKPTYTPAVHATGCGIRIANNLFTDSASSAMRLEGNDFLIERNRIDGVVNESDDQGGIDTWYNPSYRGITIRHNYWSNITGGTLCGAAGIRLDDMISDVTILGNVFVNCGAVHFGAVQIHGGKDNRVLNNVMLDCACAVSFTPWGAKRYLEALDGDFVREKTHTEVNIDSPEYQQKYPNLAHIRDDADVNTLSHNLVVNGKNLWRNDKGIQKTEGNVVLTEKGTTSQILERILAPEFLKENGLQPLVPLSEIGPQQGF